VIDPYFGGILAPATVNEGWEPAGHPHGTLMVARRACLDGVGIFDERYFAYCEEADLALRAKAAGWESGLVRGAMVKNPYVGSASAAIDYLQLRNTLLLVREHSGAYHAFIRFCIALWHLASGAIIPTRRGPYWNVEGRVRALVDFLRGRYGPPPAHLLVKR
jgi:GT2 family glycosyltransferase